ncbi:phage baseplate assembly protein V [Acinetobacter cumulans]|uniref:Phage baseplate assembly protein V n=1 Tax=Acinetobacter cumulans TaxID=2136182 RepID=A0A498CVB5_9GAMM|nr:phage baseplate assembly protein V [Acinetobacter cumulans]RLL33732.1 phage baseplate assembly protein V [Acinetobacter cumulans]
MSAELHRRLENLIRFGTIKTIHPAKPFTTVTVTIGEITTAKLRFLTLRAGKTKTWDPPTVGEEVVVISPSGVLEMGVAIAGFNNKENPSPSDNLDQTIRVFEDGCVFTYDVSSHHLSAILPPGGTVELTANSGVTVNANGGVTVNANDGLTINAVSGGTTHNGNLTVNGSTVTTGNSTVQGSQLVQGSSHSTGQFSTEADVTAGDISLKSHKTPGVKSGSEISGEPIP